MEKIIRLSIENTTKIRQVEDSFCELYSHDKNNGAFEFEISKGTLTNENVVALFKFLRSGSYWKTNGSVEENKIKFNFDTSLITQNEDVVCYIYLDKEERNSDIFRFKFKVNLSEIDKANQLPVKERYFANSMIVDRVDVLTKEDFEKALAEISKGSHFLTENQANEKYALKTDIPNISNLATTQELEKRALKTEIPSTETIVNKAVEEVEKKGYLTEHQPLTDYALKSEIPKAYDDNEIKQRLTSLEGRPTLPSINPEDYVTKNDLDTRGYLTQHQDISNLATRKSVEDVEAKVTQLESRPVTSSYDDSEIKQKIRELEARPTTANVDTSNFVTTTQLESKHYLTEHQDVSNLATKQELQEVSNNQPTVDTSNLATKQELQELRGSQPNVDNLATKEELRKAFLDEDEHEKYAKKSELPQPYNDTDIKSRLTTLENRPAGNVGSGELRGHGRPTAEAPIGTTYIDEDVTDGALKWIKTKTTWKVVEGDTGWVSIPIYKFIQPSKMEVRRINNIVHVRFSTFPNDGLVRISEYYSTKPPYLTLYSNGYMLGWRPTQKVIQPILPEVNFSNSEHTYDSSQSPHPYLRLNPQPGMMNVELYIDEFTVTNSNFGFYINAFSYLTEDDWPSSLTI